MKKAPIPHDEDQRIKELQSYNILDTPAEMEFDEITELAALICGTSISLVSLVDTDRQWFKSKFGLEAPETPRDISYCGHAIHGTDIFVVEDSEKDQRFCDNPLFTKEPHVRFYAGAPLVTTKGHKLGTLCVIDQKSKRLSEFQTKALRLLARNVVNLLELKKRKELEAVQAMVVTYSHELNNPLQIAIGYIEKLKKQPDNRDALNKLDDSIVRICDVVKSIRKITESNELEFSQYVADSKMVKTG